MTFSTGTNLLAFTVAYEATVEKAWWDVIIAALATPWNLPVYPSLDQAWGYTFLPTPQSSDYRKQSANPAGSATFEGKQSQPLKVNNAAAAAAQTDLVIPFITRLVRGIVNHNPTKKLLIFGNISQTKNTGE